MTLDRLDYNGVYSVAENMREWDRREIYATRWNEDPADLATDAMRAFEFGWLASGGETPIAVIGGIPMHPGVWSVFMFATPEFHKIRVAMTRFALRQLKPVLTNVAHRIECRSMEGHEDAQNWLELIGFSRESSIPKYGKNGETFHLYAWINPNPEKEP